MLTNDPRDPRHPAHAKCKDIDRLLCATCETPLPATFSPDDTPDEFVARIDALKSMGWVSRDGVWICAACEAPAPDLTARIAAAVHDDRLWDIDKLEDGMLHNLGPTPIPAKDLGKSGFKKILAARGLNLKDQQESSMGPESLLIPEPEKKDVPTAPAMTEGHARVIVAFSRFLERYVLRESLWCDLCFQLAQNSGTRVTKGNDGHSLSITCRCSIRHITTVTELSYTRPSPIGVMDRTSGAIDQPGGERLQVPTLLISDEDAALALRHIAVLGELQLNNMLLCFGCREACEMTFEPNQIIVACKCHLRIWQSRVTLQ